MKTNFSGFTGLLVLGGLAAFASGAFAQATPAAKPYSIVNSTNIMGTGGIDYVYADNDNRRLYIPRGNQVLVFDEDTLKSSAPSPMRGRTASRLTPSPATAFAAAARS